MLYIVHLLGAFLRIQGFSPQQIRGEALPNYARDLTMSFVAQDGINPAVSDEMTIHRTEEPLPVDDGHHYIIEPEDSVNLEENLSLEDKEEELIKKALLRNNGKRKRAARDLGISERTLYRKIKQYELD